MIEVMFAIRKDGFKDHPVIPDGLDLVDEEDQFTHMMPLEDDYNTEDILSKNFNTVDTCITSLSITLYQVTIFIPFTIQTYNTIYTPSKTSRLFSIIDIGQPWNCNELGLS